MKMEITLPGEDVVEAHFQGHRVRTAQDGSSPEPFDLFLASIGTCVGFYVGKFCSQRKIPAEGIRVFQSFERDPDTRMIRRIEIDVELPETFPERYRRAVIRAAGQCSVKKHLVDPPIIMMRAVTGGGATR